MNILYLPLVIFTLVILLYITYQDIKYREINIMSLLVLAIVSLIYLGFFIFKSNTSLWWAYFLQIIVTFVFLLIFYGLGKLSYFTYIGEGDLYTIMALSFTNIFNIYFPMFVFFFALLLTLLVPTSIFLFNVFKRNYPKFSFFKALYLMFLGYPLSLNKITKFYTPLEKLTLENNKVVSNIIYAPNIEPEKEILLLKNFAKKNNISKIWVSPLVPFVILILISYILVIFLYIFDLMSVILNQFI